MTTKKRKEISTADLRKYARLTVAVYLTEEQYTQDALKDGVYEKGVRELGDKLREAHAPFYPRHYSLSFAGWVDHTDEAGEKWKVYKQVWQLK